MGTYLNPGNSGFAEILTEKYIDKTGMISVINSTIGTGKKLTCILVRVASESLTLHRCSAPTMTGPWIRVPCLKNPGRWRLH